MKKVLSIFMSLVMLLSVTAGLNLTAGAYDEGDEILTYGDLTYEVQDDGTIAITGCKETVTTINIPAEIDGKAVTSIDYGAFNDCYNLTSIAVDESNTAYSSVDGVLFNNDKTELIRYPIGNTRTTYDIPNSVTSICWFAFYDCYGLTSITVDESNTAYSSVDGVLFNKDKTKLIQYPIGNTRTTYDIPNSVRSIGDNAFWDCTSLTTITIPSGFTNDIETYYLSRCIGLTSIIVDENNTAYSSLDGALFNKDKTKLIYYPLGLTTNTYSIPNSVTSIGKYAFLNCTSLTSVTIPKSVTYIDWCAFCFYDILTDVYYSGTKEQWDLIFIHDGNNLNGATIHCTDGVINEKSTEPNTSVPDKTEPDNTNPQPTDTSQNTNDNSNNTNNNSNTTTTTTTTIAPAPTTSTTTTTAQSQAQQTPATSTTPITPTTTTQAATESTTTTVKKPKSTSIKSLKKGKKRIKATWKKVGGVKGYQVQVATDKKFKKNKKTVTIKKQKTTSTTIKKLKSNKKYYVRVRTYKTVNGKKVYSNWSKVKTVKTK